MILHSHSFGAASLCTGLLPRDSSLHGLETNISPCVLVTIGMVPCRGGGGITHFLPNHFNERWKSLLQQSMLSISRHFLHHRGVKVNRGEGGKREFSLSRVAFKNNTAVKTLSPNLKTCYSTGTSRTTCI